MNPSEIAEDLIDFLKITDANKQAYVRIQVRIAYTSGERNALASLR